jgi:hypothetical protein
VKGPHEECGFRLTGVLKRLLLYVGGERGTIASHCYDTLIFLEYAIVAMGRHSMNVDVAVMR